MSRWEFPENFTIPVQAIRDDVYMGLEYPDMATCSEEEVKKRWTEHCNRIYPQCPVIVADFTVPPCKMEDCLG